MKKKSAYISVGIILTLILTFSWISYANKPTAGDDKLVSINREQSVTDLFDESNEQNVNVGRQAEAHSENNPEFHLKIKFQDEGDYDFDYHKNEKGQIDSHARMRSRGTDVSFEGQKAITFLESLMGKLDLTPETSKNDVLTKIQNILGIDLNLVKNFELNVTFDDGKSLQIHEDFKPHKK